MARASRWRKIEDITRGHLSRGNRVLIVCSAISGTTDLLEETVAALDAGRDPAPTLAAVRSTCTALARDLGLSPSAVLAPTLFSLEKTVAACARPVPPPGRAAILAHGELLLTRLASAWLRERGLDAALVDARQALQALPPPPNADEAEAFLSARCGTARCAEAQAHLDATGASVVVTQGFIARDAQGDTVLLGRGGSDASAAYLAAAIGARRLEIWTDVPGMFSANPRVVQGARLLRRLSYEEASTLGSMGAKVLHPRTIEPARSAGMTVRVGWTEQPQLAGTEIGAFGIPPGLRAITSRRDVLLLVMRRRDSRELVGFMAEAAACFQRCGLSMDLIASSPAEIRATVDLAAFPSARTVLPRLLGELERVCRPSVVEDVGCISLAGSGLGPELLGRAFITGRLEGAGVHLVSHAADGSHISLIVDGAQVDQLVVEAHRALLAGCGDAAAFGPSWESLQDQSREIAPSGTTGGAATQAVPVSLSRRDRKTEKGSTWQANR